MKKLTRREILQSLAGLSVLGTVAPGLRAVAGTVAPGSAGNPSISGNHDGHVSAALAGDPTTISAAPNVALGTIQLSGAVGPTTVASGTVAMIVGDIDLRGDLIVEGLLTSVDTFTLRGNGFQIEVRNGGQLDLRGVPKSGWVRGTAASGWRAGDSILTAPVGQGRYAPYDFHTGTPGVVKMADGRSISAERFNLTRSITIDNVSRIMFHMGAGRQVLKHLSVRNSGVTGKLAFYPIHFHLNGNTTRGSIVEGVVVENGRFHAFVPHASHGITFLDCIAFNVMGDAYWWDLRAAPRDTSNDSNDIVWQHCLAAFVHAEKGSNDSRLTGFFLGNGTGNRCLDCTAVAIQGGQSSSGFHWPEKAESVWEFKSCVAHNIAADGIFVWQNNGHVHRIQDFIGYSCGKAGIENGAYANNFQYVRVSLTDTTEGVISHALTRSGSDAGGQLLFQDVVSNSGLFIGKHRVPSKRSVIYRSCRFSKVVVKEQVADGGEPGTHELFDCQLEPSDIEITAIHPASIIRISEQGRLRWEWIRGAWSQI